MDDAAPALPPTDAPSLSIATLLAFVGLLAIAAGWFLPWLARIDVGAVGLSRADLERLDANAKRDGVPERVTEVARRMLENHAVNGNDLAILGQHFVGEAKDLPPRERRGWTLGLATLRWAPWAAAAAALGLLLGRLRKPGALALAFALTVAILVGGFAGLMWLGASEQAKDAVADDPRVLGLGIHAIALGGLTALLAGLFAMRTSTWWKVVPLTGLAVAGVVIACVRYVGPP